MIGLSIRRPVAVAMAYLALGVLGVAAWRNIPIELLPDTELPQLAVQAWWWNASPEAMEALVTSPLEAAVQQIQGVEKVFSISDEEFGAARATITVEFTRDTDMDFARLDLSERLAALERDLPPGVYGPRIQPYVPQELRQQERAFLQYTLTGPHTLEALRTHVEDEVVPALLQVDGVATVETLGGRDRLLEIVLDEEKMTALGLDPMRVRAKIEELEYVSEAGVIRENGRLRTLAIRHTTESAHDVRAAPVLIDAGRVVRVRDVATVHDTFEEPTALYRIDGLPAVAFVVHKEIGVNTVRVAGRVKQRLVTIEHTHPPGVRLILDEDESEVIETQLTSLRYRALIAAVVIFTVLVLFLRSFRSAGIVFATIGFSILIALNLMYFGGFTLNVLTLMGLAMGFGLIVDNAIVVLENVYRKISVAGTAKQESTRRPADPRSRPWVEATVADAAREVVLPILAATLTTLIVFIPFVYLQGELRVYYVPLAIVVGMSLLASLFVAFSFIPALAAKILIRGAGDGGPAGSGEAARGGGARRSPLPAPRSPIYVRFYSGLLGGTLRYPWVTVVLAALTLGGSYYLFQDYVVRGVIWRNWWGEQTYVEVVIRLPRGEELERTDDLTRYFEERLAQLPEVERYVTNVRPQYAVIRITFPDSLEATRVPVATKDQMTAYSMLFSGAEVRVYGYGPSFYGGGGSPPNYSIKVAGYNYETVRRIAEDLGLRLARFSRVRDVDVNAAPGMFRRDKATEFVLRVDRARLGLHGLSTRDVVWQVAAAVQGRVRGDRIRVRGEEVAFEVKLARNRRLDVVELRDLLLQTSSGDPVRLSDVSALEEREILSRIVREDQQYQRYVSYEFRGPTKLGDRIRDVAVGATDLPAGYRIETSEEWRWSVDEQRQIWGVLVISLVLVFMVTAALFESLRQPLCVLLAVPMALVGVFLLFLYTGASFTREAYIGVIMMGGIVVNNAILLVDHVNRLRRLDGLELRAATIRGTLERVRPILMTSTTTIFGLLPLVLFSEFADANIWNALGFALIGGLASSTLFVLTVTPALYLLFERGPERRRLAAPSASV